jgi:RNA polymerase nonessential primary-like sigma factor
MISCGEGPTHYAQSKDPNRGRHSHRTEDTNNKLACPPLARDLPQDPTAQEDQDNDGADHLARTDIDAPDEDGLNEDVIDEHGNDQDDSRAEIYHSGARELHDRLSDTGDDFYFSKAANHDLLTPQQEADIAQRRDEAFNKFLLSLYSCEIAVNECVSAVECSVSGNGGMRLQQLFDLRLLGMKSSQAKQQCQQLLPTIAELREQAATLYTTAIAADPFGSGSSPAWAALKEVRFEIATLVQSLGVRREFAETYRQKVAKSAQMVKKLTALLADCATDGSGHTDGGPAKLRHDLSQLLTQFQETPTSVEATAKKIHADFEKYTEIRDEFVVANLRLAIAQAKQYVDRGLDFDDLVQEANRGLVAAAEKFAPSFGGKFSTYAVPWIRQRIRRGIVDHGNTIRVPVHHKKGVYLIMGSRNELFCELGRPPHPEEIAAHATASANRTLEKKLGDILRTKLGRDPTPDEIAERLESTRQTKISAEDVVVLLRAAAIPLSLDQSTVGDGTEGHDSWAAVLPDPRSEAVERENVLRQGRLELDLPVLLRRWLTPRERIIVEMRFGLSTDRREYTLSEVGTALKLTRERVRLLEKRALDKLRALKSLPEVSALE